MIDGPNLYAYVTNDPINYIDPMGTAITIGNDPGIWEDDINIPDPISDIFDAPSGSPKMDEVAMSDPGPINSGQSAGDCKIEKQIAEKNYNQYKLGVTSFSYSNVAYLPLEGKGILGSSNINGYYKVEKDSEDTYFLTVSATGSTNAKSEEDEISWYGKVIMNSGDSSVAQQLSVDESEAYLVNSGSQYIGETTFVLPSSGDVSFTIQTSYYLSVYGGGGTPIGEQNETFNIYP